MEEIKVKIDKRIEVLGVCLRLSDYHEKFNHLVGDLKNYPYLEEADRYFAKFQNHKAIKLLNECIKKLSFSYDAPVQLMLFLDEEWNFHGQNEYPFVNRLKKSEVVLDFLKELKNFVKESNFEEFFNQHQDYYQQEIDSFNSCFELSQVVDFMKKLKMNVASKHFVINLALLLTNGGYGYFNGDNVFCTMSRMADKEGNVDKIWGYNSAGEKSLFLHEFSHSFVNPLTEKYWEQIDKPVLDITEREVLAKNAYSDVFAIICEYVIRAIQLSFIRQHSKNVDWFFEISAKTGYSKNILLAVADKIEEHMQDDKTFEENYLEIANEISKAVENKKDCYGK